MSKPLECFSLSSDIINLYPNHQGEIRLTNKHKQHNISYKIKTSKQNTFDVKPPKALIKPGQIVTINFKLINSNNIAQSEEEKHLIQRNDKFLLEAILVTSKYETKEQAQEVWKRMKDKDPKLQLLGYGYYKLPIQLTSNPIPYEHSKIKKPLESKPQQEKFNPINSFRSNFRDFDKKENSKEAQINGEDLSNKYQQLRDQEIKLLQRRQKIFAPNVRATSQGSLLISLKQIIIILIMLTIGFLMGNFVKAKFVPNKVVAPEKMTSWDKFKSYLHR